MTVRKKKNKDTVFPPLWGERREEVGDPTVEEAREREFKFLHSLEVADSTFDQMLINKDWLKLGFTTFAEWWRVRVTPVMHSLEVKPVSAVVEAGIQQVREDNAELPRAQRTTQAEVAEMFGVSEATVGRRAGTRSTPATFVAGSDLGHRTTPRAQRADAIMGHMEKITELEAQATLDQAQAEDLDFRRTQLRQLEYAEVMYAIGAARNELIKVVSEIRLVGLRFEGDELLDLLNLLTKLDDTAKELRTTLTTTQPDLDEELRELTNGE